MLSNIILFLIAAPLCWFLCGKVRERLLSASVLDTPNERSLHKVPVPRGGGIGIWLAVIPLWIMGTIIQGNFPDHIFLILGTCALITISWIDDKKSLPARKRFAVHMVAVAFGLIAIPINQFVFQGALPLWLDRAVAGFAWLWFINLTNFMDGIDGISGAQTAHVSFSFIVLCFFIPAIPASAQIIAFLLLGAVTGFLFWNWHPAKLFLGDVGSIPIGFLLGYLMMVLAANGYLGIAITLPLYYVGDASYTLIRRIMEKKKFWEAHREHFYQKAALAVGHINALKPIIIGNIGLFAIAIISVFIGQWLCLLAPLLVAGLLWYLNRLSQQKV